MPCNLPYQAILSDAGLAYRPTPCAPILISASSNISSTSYLQEMTCWTRCRHSSQNIPKLTSAHWASHQATGRMSHCGAHDNKDRNCHPNLTCARKSKCKSRAEHQARLNAMPRCSFAYAKQVKIVKSSLSVNPQITPNPLFYRINCK